jgi:hypothetical protein
MQLQPNNAQESTENYQNCTKFFRRTSSKKQRHSYFFVKDHGRRFIIYPAELVAHFVNWKNFRVQVRYDVIPRNRVLRRPISLRTRDLDQVSDEAWLPVSTVESGSPTLSKVCATLRDDHVKISRLISNIFVRGIQYTICTFEEKIVCALLSIVFILGATSSRSTEN